jgi:GDP-mannose 6-dehydrogenase
LKISVLGLGYVGCVSAACFAELGHEVIGVDVSLVKVTSIAEGKCPIVEPRVDEMIANHAKSGRLTATMDAHSAILNTDISLVCVGTPGQSNGSLDLSYIRGSCDQIGQALKSKNGFHIIVMRSTMLPGTVHETVVPTLEKASGKKNGVDFAVAINPEFLREGTAVIDFYEPPFTLIGTDHEQAKIALTALYKDIKADLYETSVREAEMVKYSCNCFHALKVSFANEIGNICKAVGIDSHRVMEVFCKDDKLNLSPYYLKPGFAFGGSCLPKDLRAINYKARIMDIETPVLSSALASNELQIQRAFDRVLAAGTKRVAMLGLSFKPGTDDMRESPMVELAERLIGKGVLLKIYDKEVSIARLQGANKAYIENEIPHISSLMSTDLEEIIKYAELIVVCKKDNSYAVALNEFAGERLVYDLARNDSIRTLKGYDGICW